MKKGILIIVVLVCALRSTAQNNLIDSLNHIVSLHRHDTVEFDALMRLSNEFIRRDLLKAKQLSFKTLSITNTQEHAKWRSGAYNYLVTIYQQLAKPDSALYYLKLSEELVNLHPNNVKLRFNYNQAAGIFYKNMGALKKALPYLLENTKIWTKEDENKAGQLLNLGNLYFTMGNYQQAMEAHLQSLSLFEKLGNNRGQSFCLQGLGNDFLELRQFEKSKEYYTRSLQLKEELQDKRGIITASTGLGDVYKESKQYTVSEKYYNRALKEAQQMKLVGEEARCYYQLSLLYKRMGETEKTRSAINQASKLANQTADSTLISRINGNLIALKFEEEEKEKEKGVETSLISNLNTVVNSGDRGGEVMEYSRLSDYYASKNQFDKAFYYLQKHDALKDSVEGSQVLLQMKNLEEQYQNDKKEKEIELLKKDQELQTLALSRERTNVILIAFALISVMIISVLLVNRYRIMNRAKRELELEKVRNHIARDLHDDIGSTLSSINIMSQLAMKGDTKENLNKIAWHSAQMMENMSDIVWSINPKNDTLEQVILKMKEFAFEILEPKEITHTFQVESNLTQLKLDVEKRKNLFLIFKEAINNAAKYSGGNTVSVSLSVKQNKVQLSIIDNGKGFDETLVKRGNGLINMKERAASLGGNLFQRSTPGKGTEIHVDIPIT